MNVNLEDAEEIQHLFEGYLYNPFSKNKIFELISNLIENKKKSSSILRGNYFLLYQSEQSEL